MLKRKGSIYIYIYIYMRECMREVLDEDVVVAWEEMRLWVSRG